MKGSECESEGLSDRTTGKTVQVNPSISEHKNAFP